MFLFLGLTCLVRVHKCSLCRLRSALDEIWSTREEFLKATLENCEDSKPETSQLNDEKDTKISDDKNISTETPPPTTNNADSTVAASVAAPATLLNDFEFQSLRSPNRYQWEAEHLRGIPGKHQIMSRIASDSNSATVADVHWASTKENGRRLMVRKSSIKNKIFFKRFLLIFL